MWFESQLLRINRQTFSTGFSSGHLGDDEPVLPSGPIDEEHGMSAGRRLGQVQALVD
jgi:hypothetical protein